MNIKRTLAAILVIFIFGFTTYVDKPEDIDPDYAVPAMSVQVALQEENKETSIPKTERSPQYIFSDEEIYLMAQLLSGDKSIDGDGEYDIDFRTMDDSAITEVDKVFSVVMNRVKDSRFKESTVTGIILQKGQFDTMPKNAKKTPSEKTLAVATEWCKAYSEYSETVSNVPDDHIYFRGNGLINTTFA